MSEDVERALAAIIILLALLAATGGQSIWRYLGVI